MAIERRNTLATEASAKGYRKRCERLIDFFATRDDEGYLGYREFIEVIAKLYRDAPRDEITPILDPLLERPRGDMFWMYPMTVVAHLGQDRLPVGTLERIRDQWRTYTPYRGDTENHWAMYYASLYLMSELYPDESSDGWFNGRSSAENRDDAREYLESWIDLTTTEGQGEYDSPHYMPFFIAPMAMLHAFARDEGMRNRAGMMLDYILADFAVDTLDGLYVGAFSRVYPEPLLERSRNGSTTFAWLLFGNTEFAPDRVNVVLEMPGYRPHGVALLLAISGYMPPKAIFAAGTDRSRPLVHRELKRTRQRIRYSAERSLPVYKYLRMRPEYALGSTQGGLLQPIQQHTWELFWRTDNTALGHNLLFTIHPYASSEELAMYFPEEPELLTEAVIRGKKETYDSPNKWTGGSPYEHVFQHEDVVIALYDIPAGTRFPHIAGFFSRHLEDLREDDSGWIFARGGDAMIACYPLAPYEWHSEGAGDRRLHSPHLKNGMVVQVAPVSDFVDRSAFEHAVRALTIETDTLPIPHVRFETLARHELEFAVGEVPRVDGSEVDYAGWPLYDGPFLRAARGSRMLDLRHGEEIRRLDFERFEVTTFTERRLTDEVRS
jgi:hypothetical protein